MRILIATQLEGIEGGRETYLRSVVPLLREEGHELGFAFECPAPVHMTKIPANDPGPVWYLPHEWKILETWKPDVVMLNGFSDPALELRLAGNWATVYFPHAYYGTCISGAKCHTWPTVQPCERTLGIGCLAAYFPRGCGGKNPLTMFRRYWHESKRLSNLGLYRAVMVASNHMADEYRRHGVADGRLHLARLFPTDIIPDAIPPLPKPLTNRVLFVGRITPLKGLQHLIEAMPMASRTLGRALTLVVAGDGLGKQHSQMAAERAGVSAEFLGWVSAEYRTKLMRTADVLAVPSVWPEPFGLVGVEAGCVGMPSVGYASGGISDWLIPGVSGESAAGRNPNPQSLASALVRALSDAAHYQRLRVGAWQTSQQFNRVDHVHELCTLLEECALAPV